MTSLVDAFGLAVVTHATVAIVTGSVAILLLASNPCRTWNQWLAFFLALVCGNFALNGLAIYVEALHLLETGVPGYTPTSITLRSLGFLCLFFDPAALAYFASIFPRRTALATRWWGVPLLAAPVLVLTALELQGASVSTATSSVAPVRLALAGYLASCYLYAAWRILASYLAEPSTVMARQVGAVAVGVLGAMLPRVALVSIDVLPFGLRPSEYILDFAFRLATLWLLYVAAVLMIAHARTPPDRRRGARGMMATVLVVFLVLSGLWSFDSLVQILHLSGRGVPESLLVLGAFARDGLTFTTRWIVFPAAMVVGIVRYQVFAVPPRALAFLCAGVAGVSSFVATGLGAMRLGAWFGAAAAVVLASAVLGLVLLAHRGWAPAGASPALKERALEVYRANLAAATAQGHGAPTPDELRRLRDELRVSREEHLMLQAITAAEEGRLGGAGPVHGGPANGGPGDAGPGGAGPAPEGYAILRWLGSGASASVHLARDLDRGHLVVLKRIRRDWVGQAACEAAARELEVARRVSHPNLVAIHAVVRLDREVVVVMEHVDGGSLRDLLEEGRPLPAARAARILRDVLEALAALHEAGVVHGDLKPENILLTGEGHLKVADFGSATASPRNRTLLDRRRPTSAGTPAYLAPERLQGAPPGPSADLYAAGVIGIELAAAGRTWWDPGEGPPSLEDAPPAWRAFLAKATAPDPSLRHASARAMASEVPAGRAGGRPKRPRAVDIPKIAGINAWG